jgi:hypothetical protein
VSERENKPGSMAEIVRRCACPTSSSLFSLPRPVCVCVCVCARARACVFFLRERASEREREQEFSLVPYLISSPQPVFAYITLRIPCLSLAHLLHYAAKFCLRAHDAVCPPPHHFDVFCSNGTKISFSNEIHYLFTLSPSHTRENMSKVCLCTFLRFCICTK